MKKIIVGFIAAAVMALFSTVTFAASLPSLNGATVKDGTYTLRNVYSGYMLNVYAGTDANSIKVITWQYDGSVDQRVKPVHIGNGRYYLYAACSSSGRVIDVLRGSSITDTLEEGDYIDIYDKGDDEAQIFNIVPVGDKKYVIELKSRPGCCIAPGNASSSAVNGTHLQLKWYTGATYQQWQFCDVSGNVVDPTYAYHNISYNANGGSGAPGVQGKVNGVAVTLSATTPTRTGYSFQGWSTASGGAVQYQPGSTYSDNSSVTLYAVWKANTYTVSYNANGGSGAPSAQTKTHGQNLTLSTATPTRTGYSFQGWSTTSGGAAQYQPGGTYSNEAGVTLYAVWKINSYTLKIKPCGGVFTDDSGSHTEDVVYTKNYGEKTILGKAERNGYDFVCWAIDCPGAGGMRLDPWGVPLISDPVFNIGSANMGVYNNTGNGNVKIERVATDNTACISSAYMMKITNTGEAAPGLGGFHQITTSKAGGVFYHIIKARIPIGYTIQRASNSCGDNASFTWLTPQEGTGEWETYIYKTACGSSGTFSTFGHVYLTGSAGTANAPVTWYVAYAEMFDGTGIDFNSAGNSFVCGGTAYLLAQWRAKTYTVSYDANGGDDAPQNQLQRYGKSIKISESIPKRDGYLFRGWASSADSSDVEYIQGDSFEVNDNATLYAVWQEIDYVSDEIKIGDYLQMGTYYGAPILWRCVDIDSNGPLMLADKIICIKPFDVGGSDINSSHGRSTNSGEFRQHWGSNYWGDSNIRSWLNSDERAGNVNWLCGNPPSTENLNGKYNAYSDESGFVTNFKSGEINAVKSVKQDSLLQFNEYDDMSLYGTESHISNDESFKINESKLSVNDIVQNAKSTAYKEDTTDRFFLLDVNQVYKVYKNINILGDNYYLGVPTEEAIANAEDLDTEVSSQNIFPAWLRSPCAASVNGDRVLYINTDGVGHNNPVNSYGIRPAFYLDTSAFASFTGSGTDTKPYEISYDGSGVSGGISWRISGGTLYISGGEEMPDYTEESAPWSYAKGAVKKIVFENSELAAIGANAFEGMYCIETVVLPDSICNINENAFLGCSDLKKIKFPAGMNGGIGERAFADCTSLTAAEVPDGVVSIGEGVFDGCTSLSEITVPFIGSLSGESNTKNTFAYIFGGNVPESLKKVNVTKETVVPECAFKYLYNIENISLNKGIKVIGNEAFYGCSSLKQFEIPSGVMQIKDSTFYGCESMSSVIIPGTVKEIGESAFDECTALKEVVIPDGITEIKDYTFYNCKSLISISIPDSVENIGEAVLGGCDRVAAMKIPFVGANDHPGATEVTSEGVLGYFFGGDNEAVPPSVTKIEVTCPNKNGYIPKEAFKDCANIVDIIINGGNSILDGAFENCRNLKNLYIPNSISTMGTNLLVNCSKLNTLTVPFIGKGKLDQNTETSVLGAFFGYDDDDITGTMQYYNQNGDYHYYRVPHTLKNVSVLSQTNIPYGAFMECGNLEQVSIVTGAVMNDYTFYNCTGLKKVSLPNDLKTIGYEAFAECESLESINLPYNTKTIGENAFYNARKLKEITIPRSVENIADEVFNGTGLYSADDDAELMAAGLTIVCAAGSKAEEFAKDHKINYKVVSDDELNIRTTATTVELMSDYSYMFDITDSYRMNGTLYVELYNDKAVLLTRRTRAADDVEYRIEFSEDDMENVSFAKIYVANENGVRVSTVDEIVSRESGDIPTVPESDIVIVYDGESVILNGTVVPKPGSLLIEEVYSGGSFKGVNVYAAPALGEEFTPDGEVKGDTVKYMLWDGFEKMKPLADAVEG